MENLHRIDLKIVGKRIRKVRKEQGLTQEKAAELAETSSQYWCLLESGRERGSVDMYLKIATALGLTLDDLFYDAADAIKICKAFSHDRLLADCTPAERIIISEVLLELKTSLTRNRRRW